MLENTKVTMGKLSISFLKLLKSFFFFLVGAALFLYILLYIIYSFIGRCVKYIFKLPGLYNLREKEYPLLDISIGDDPAYYKAVLIGTLPDKILEAPLYSLPSSVPSSAKELLIRARLFTGSNAACLEYEYCIYGYGEESNKAYFYLFVRPFPDDPNIHFTECLFWFAMPQSRRLQVQFMNVHNEGGNNSFNSELEIIKWR